MADHTVNRTKRNLKRLSVNPPADKSAGYVTAPDKSGFAQIKPK
jgi:hypothetical protein